jgi:dGTPase
MEKTIESPTIREKTEELEDKYLSKFATKSKDTRGRVKPIELCPLRTEYQRDRDRIIHCKAFRRLSHKTQVFLAPEGDHYRTRLTHTLEVSQISRTIARALSLNEDLAEAIALGHDLGHTPFGHEGEHALNMFIQKAGGNFEFKHNKQSLRVVDVLEYEGKGLNLTYEVRDGILNHTGKTDPVTLEGKIVKIADRIAYVNHDLDDAIRANVITVNDIPGEPIRILGKNHGVRINALVVDMIASSKNGEISLSSICGQALLELRSFLFNNVYVQSDAKVENWKVDKVIGLLFTYFLEKPEHIPADIKATADSEIRAVADYIAGMTDRYAISTFEKMYVPKGWK